MAVLASGEAGPSSARQMHASPHCTKKALEMVRRNAYCALQHISHFGGKLTMTDETKVQAAAAAEAPAKVAEAVADTAQKVVKASATVAKRERAKSTRRVKRQAVAEKTAEKATARRTKAPRRKVR